MVVVHRQQIALACVEPASRGGALALWAMAVAAGVIGDLVTPTIFTAQRMSPQRSAAALLDGRHDSELAQAQVPTLSLAPSEPMYTEDVSDLQGGPPHDGALRRGHDLDRRNHFAQDLGADLCIKCRGFQLLVPEQDLDHADVDLLLEQVSGERVTQA